MVAVSALSQACKNTSFSMNESKHKARENKSM
jgi:hypothetical protein